MRAFMTFALVLLTSLTAQPATFEEANQLYEQGRYADARASYESLQKEGRVSANLFYNLGNTEYRLNERGRAALEYERALALEPDHPEARTNLELVRKQTGARLLPASVRERFVLPWSSGAYSVLTALALWAAIFAGAGIVFFRQRDSFTYWGLAITGMLAGGYGAFALSWHASQRSLAIVLEPEVTARVAAADRAAAVEPLPAGSRVRVLRERGAWVYCALPGAGRGWLPRKSIETLQPGAAS